MWAFDVASIGCLAAALWVRWRWRDPQGGFLLVSLSSTLSTWSSFCRRWRRRAESED